jgi:hypothetical protein
MLSHRGRVIFIFIFFYQIITEQTVCFNISPYCMSLAVARMLNGPGKFKFAR